MVSLKSRLYCGLAKAALVADEYTLEAHLNDGIAQLVIKTQNNLHETLDVCTFTFEIAVHLIYVCIFTFCHTDLLVFARFLGCISI